MRFSLKWLLAGTAYAAVAAAAFGTGEWFYADALWVTSLLAIVYAATLAILATGRERWGAVAFAFACGCFLTCLMFGGDAVPSARILAAAGYSPFDGNPTMKDLGDVRIYGATTDSSGRLSVRFRNSQGGLGRASFALDSVINAVSLDFATRLRAANAVATLAFGLMGSLVGLLAYRAAGREGN
jgi:hypothetical protein